MSKRYNPILDYFLEPIKYRTFYIGIVEDENDEINQGRLKVKVPELTGENGWVYVKPLLSNFTSLKRPDKGDLVLVLRYGYSPENLFYIGPFYNIKNLESTFSKLPDSDSIINENFKDFVFLGTDPTYYLQFYKNNKFKFRGFNLRTDKHNFNFDDVNNSFRIKGSNYKIEKNPQDILTVNVESETLQLFGKQKTIQLSSSGQVMINGQNITLSGSSIILQSSTVTSSGPIMSPQVISQGPVVGQGLAVAPAMQQQSGVLSGMSQMSQQMSFFMKMLSFNLDLLNLQKELTTIGSLGPSSGNLPGLSGSPSSPSPTGQSQNNQLPGGLSLSAPSTPFIPPVFQMVLGSSIINQLNLEKIKLIKIQNSNVNFNTLNLKGQTLQSTIQTLQITQDTQVISGSNITVSQKCVSTSQSEIKLKGGKILINSDESSSNKVIRKKDVESIIDNVVSQLESIKSVLKQAESGINQQLQQQGATQDFSLDTSSIDSQITQLVNLKKDLGSKTVFVG